LISDFKPSNYQAGPAYTILAPGFAKWWGSDARALAQAFRSLGHNLIEIDEEDFVPWRPDGFAPKVLRRLFGGLSSGDYNHSVLQQAASSAYDFALIYKGNLLWPTTVRRIGQNRTPVYNFYPDVSFQDHGKNIPRALPIYDCVFTTKSYHGDREKTQFSIREFQHVRHGFDPEVHRPVSISAEAARHYGCDVSFVGCWSPEKEARILYVLQQRGELVVRVFGRGWNHASPEFKRRIAKNLKPGVFGDELAIVYRTSRVNLGLLSTAKSDDSTRDQTTARTFQIPATGSLMLHEDTPEVRTLFRAGEEVLLFNSNDDLVRKIDLALGDPVLRERLGDRAFQRCHSEPYDYSAAAQNIIRYFEIQTHRRPKVDGVKPSEELGSVLV
jgi:spore maturation protein CgeB